MLALILSSLIMSLILLGIATANMVTKPDAFDVSPFTAGDYRYDECFVHKVAQLTYLAREHSSDYI